MLAGLKAGAITEMSYAYEATRWDSRSRKKTAACSCAAYAANVFDVSDVTWGMTQRHRPALPGPGPCPERPSRGGACCRRDL